MSSTRRSWTDYGATLLKPLRFMKKHPVATLVWTLATGVGASHSPFGAVLASFITSGAMFMRPVEGKLPVYHVHKEDLKKGSSLVLAASTYLIIGEFCAGLAGTCVERNLEENAIQIVLAGETRSTCKGGINLTTWGGEPFSVTAIEVVRNEYGCVVSLPASGDQRTYLKGPSGYREAKLSYN